MQVFVKILGNVMLNNLHYCKWYWQEKKNNNNKKLSNYNYTNYSSFIAEIL